MKVSSIFVPALLELFSVSSSDSVGLLPDFSEPVFQAKVRGDRTSSLQGGAHSQTGDYAHLRENASASRFSASYAQGEATLTEIALATSGTATITNVEEDLSESRFVFNTKRLFRLSIVRNEDQGAVSDPVFEEAALVIEGTFSAEHLAAPRD